MFNQGWGQSLHNRFKCRVNFDQWEVWFGLVTTDQSQAWKITLLLTLFKGGDWYPGNYKMDRVVAYDDNGWIEEWYQIRNKEWWKIITL